MKASMILTPLPVLSFMNWNKFPRTGEKFDWKGFNIEIRGYGWSPHR